MTVIRAIDDFCETGAGSTPPRGSNHFFGTGMPWVKSGELRDGVLTHAEESVTPEGMAAARLKQVPAGSLLVAMYGATVGRTALLGIDATTNQAVCHVRPDPNQADTRYVWFALRAKLPELLGRRVGGAQPNISQQTIRTTRVYLPPLPEQKRIADILDKAESVRRKRRDAMALTEDLLRAAFLEMFGDPITNPKEWPVKLLGDLADIASGVTKGKKYDGMKTVSVPYMRVANVQDGHLVLNNVTDIVVSEEEARRYLLQSGDVLLTEGGDPDKLGRGAVWRGEVARCIHQNHIFRVRAKDDVLPDYLSALIGSQRGKRYFLRAAKQTTGIATINSTQLKGFPALVPPRALQRRYVTFLERTRGALQRQRAAALELESLFESLVQRAFRGELASPTGKRQLGIGGGGPS